MMGGRCGVVVPGTTDPNCEGISSGTPVPPALAQVCSPAVPEVGELSRRIRLRDSRQMPSSSARRAQGDQHSSEHHLMWRRQERGMCWQSPRYTSTEG